MKNTSAYFSNQPTLDNNTKIQEAGSYSISSPSSSSLSISFPTIRDILYDRTPLSYPYYIRSSSILPQLYLSKESIFSILSSLNSTSDHFIKKSIIIRSDIVEKELGRDFSLFIDHSNYLLVFNDELASRDNNFMLQQGATSQMSHISIPFTLCNDEESLSYDVESTE